jgi:HEAT repeat protein
MAASEKVKALVARMPEPDKGGTYADMDDEKAKTIEKVVAGLLEAGRAGADGLIDLLVEPGKGDDLKAHFALHVLAVRVTEPGREKLRAELARAVASQVASDRPKGVRKYLIEQLQIAGGKESLGPLGKALLDADLCDVAARALAAIGEGAADVLLAAAPKVPARCRLSIIKKLAVLRAKQAAGLFRKALADDEPNIRIAAAWGIARIADASAADALLECADAHTDWERVNQTDACMELAENLAAAGNKPAAAAIYAHLHKTRTDAADSHIRAAAQKGLAATR